MSTRLRQILPGIHRLDVNHPRPHTTCAYLVTKNDQAALIDCGGGTRGRDAILAGLAEANIAPQQIRYLLATHAHLDHAGAAGLLLQSLPNAQFAAHPSAVKHLTNPESTLAPATRTLFGTAFFNTYYGGLQPVPADRAHPLQDKQSLPLGAGELAVIATPGHAWHHLAFHDPENAFIAAGDAFGVSYRALDAKDGKNIIAPVMPPSQFAPDAMRASLHRLHALAARHIGLAHFDAIPLQDHGAAHLHMQIKALDDWQTTAATLFADQRDHFYPRMKAHILNWIAHRAAKNGISPELARQWHESDSSLSARGFEHYLKTTAA